ncbi:hypothetical protein OCK02_16005 [Rhizobium sp. TRM96647]|uniref:hypothetical protein n=1 Tax=unclassified Rhizobium TaxID=2613769 RepID=UPI0021E6F5BF|nr:MULTISPECIES: hypothetical protein [unclassified Rhizobium]MCV3737715.1 hypothetical protein [Rhizobium sp. TRM96647]MCV3759555.1 hypothetical protein [Rhizobium sp. TRM96650]
MSTIKRKSILVVGAALAGLIAGFIFSIFVLAGYVSWQEPPQLSFKFDSATTITIVLTALSIMLTVLGIVIAVVGVFGFSLLRVEASNAASERVREQFDQDGELRRVIEARVDAIVARTQAGRNTHEDFPNPNSEYGE